MTSYLPRTAAAAMRMQGGRTPLCDCPVASADADAKSPEYKQQTTNVSCAASAAQDGDGLSVSRLATTATESDRGIPPATCRRNRPARQRRLAQSPHLADETGPLYPAEMGCPDTAPQPAAQGVTSAARALPRVTETSSGCAANCWTGPGSWVCEPVIFTQMWENNRLTATQIHYGGCTHSGG